MRKRAGSLLRRLAYLVEGRRQSSVWIVPQVTANATYTYTLIGTGASDGEEQE